MNAYAYATDIMGDNGLTGFRLEIPERNPAQTLDWLFNAVPLTLQL